MLIGGSFVKLSSALVSWVFASRLFFTSLDDSQRTLLAVRHVTVSVRLPPQLSTSYPHASLLCAPMLH